MTELLAYCRAGYENDTAAELTAATAQRGAYGYPVLQADSGYVSFSLYQQEDLHKLASTLVVADTIFPRQLIAVTQTHNALDKQDRITPILESVRDIKEIIGMSGNVLVEYADTENGKQLTKFCRKFVVPLRQALRGAGLLTKKESDNKPFIHVFSQTSIPVKLATACRKVATPHRWAFTA